MNKKLITVLLSTTIMASLCGCSIGRTTANKLLDSISDIDDCVDYDIVVKADVPFTYNTLETDIKIEIEANAQKDADTTYVEGTVSTEMFSSESVNEFKQYTQINDNKKTIYNYEEDTDSWNYTTKMNNVDYFYNVDSSMFQNVKLEKNKDSYVVTGTFNAVDNFADVDYILDNIIGDSTEFDNYVATLTFDKKTKQIEQMEMTASNDDVNEFTIVVTFNEIGSDFDVSVPDDILNSATEFISNTDEAINGYEDNETGYDDAYTYDGQVVNGSSNSSNVTNSGANGTASTTETASNSSSNKTSNGTSAQNDTTNTGSTNSSGSTSNKTSSISSNLALYETISGNDIGGTSETHPYEKEKEEIVVVEEPEEAPVEVEQPKNTIGYALLGKTTITNKEASSLMNGRIPEVSDVTDRVTYICNTFTKEEYLGYVGVWEGMDSDSKNAVVWIAECTNIASINDIINAGANENEVNKILKEIR